MKKKNDLLKRLSEISDEANMLGILGEVRQTGSIEMLEPLARLATHTQFISIKKEVLNIFRDLKEKNACKVIISIIQNQDFKPIRKELITSCWEGSLDYAEFIDDFIALFISEDDETAIEVFTVIDNLQSYNWLTPEALYLIEKSSPQFNAIKSNLATELIKKFKNAG